MCDSFWGPIPFPNHLSPITPSILAGITRSRASWSADESGAMPDLDALKQRVCAAVDRRAADLIADSLRGLGRPVEAVPLAEELLRDRRAPNEAKAEAVIVAASALADQGRFPEALALLARAKTREDVAEDYTLRLWYVRGDILAKAGRGDEAATEFRKVMRHDPSAFDAAERLAELG